MRMALRMVPVIFAHDEYDVEQFQNEVQEAATVFAGVLGPSLRKIVMLTYSVDGPYWCTYDVVAGSAVRRNVSTIDARLM